tara:strand:+ start:3026 stop:3601 length:576 start_codon:yes stop_codon:yes gene_type:complete
MDLNSAIKTRKSVRRFLDRKPDWRKVVKAIDAARFAPAAGNQFALKFVFVRDKDKVKKLAEASQQSFVKQAPFAVVVVSDNAKLERSYGEHGEKYTRQQAGAAIENFLLALNAQKLATCWIGAFVEEQVKRVLEIPDSDNLTIEAIFPVGMETRAAAGRVKSKPDLENILYFDKWKNKYMEPQVKIGMENA